MTTATSTATTTATGSRASRLRGTARRTAVSALYLLAAWPLHLGLFIAVVTLTALGASTALLGGVGLVVLIVSIMLARLAAAAQRWVNATLTGRPAPGVAYLPSDPQDSALRRILAPLRDPQSWRDALWAVTGFPVSLLTWSVTVIWVSAGMSAMVAPFLEYLEYRTQEAAPNSGTVSVIGYGGLGELLAPSHPHLADVVVTMALGAFCILSAPVVLQGLARMQMGYAELLLSRQARDREQILGLRASRHAARSAEADSLRRLERDLHDGPQQGLVRLGMDLARAKRHAATDPAKTQEILDATIAQTQETLLELRRLSRGIAPPVLVDRGLEAAIMEACARSIVPVTVSASLPSSPPPPMHAASAAYFVVSEALVNVNKHSGATQAGVTVSAQEGALRVAITDNGAGGACAAKGHGLDGLIQRLAGVEGTLSIDSPVGGPTTIEAVIPCES
ncbi:sensor histidine kinase [Actinomyces slackii]|uniref:histidine kinase n=1 Tax=Actinomyces slackii TaxID=52774 RepID=A0A448KGA5_9ACTO|nr:sensor histidine kinase [Actinomyces slackii]VEG75983.1 Oxygen sensor histidine kinase nreB [Actinomyces slackii]